MYNCSIEQYKGFFYLNVSMNSKKTEKFLLKEKQYFIDNMSYTNEITELKGYVQEYKEARTNFYDTLKTDRESPNLDKIAVYANQVLDRAIELRTHISQEIVRETKSYPKSDSPAAKNFDKLSTEITGLTKERKAGRKRGIVKAEAEAIIKKTRNKAKTEIERTNKQFAERMKRIRDRKNKTREMIKGTPELAWWRARGIKTRSSASLLRNTVRTKAWTQKLMQNWKTRSNRIKKVWNTKSKNGIGIHLIGRAKARRIRKMRP